MERVGVPACVQFNEREGGKGDRALIRQVRLGGGDNMLVQASKYPWEMGKREPSRPLSIRFAGTPGTGDLIVVSPQCQCNASTTIHGQLVEGSKSGPGLSYRLQNLGTQGPFFILCRLSGLPDREQQPIGNLHIRTSGPILERRSSQDFFLILFPSRENNHEPQHHRKPAAY